MTIASTTTSASTSKFRIAIVGAGLGGLLLALFLEKNGQDIDVDVYEGATELAEVGAGLGMWPRIVEIMRYLGLEEEIVKITGSTDSSPMSIHYRKSDQKVEEDVFQISSSFRSFHRSELQHLLARRLRAADKIQFSKRLATYTESNARDLQAITLHFQDGTSAMCDLLVGSDGVRSAVRRKMYTTLADDAQCSGDNTQADKLRAMIEPVWCGEVAYRSLIPTCKLADGSAFKGAQDGFVLLGKNKNLVTYPVSRGKSINVAGFVYFPGSKGTKYDGSWVAESNTTEFLRHFEGWTDDVRDLVKATDKTMAWAVHTVPGLPTYTSGRVVLIGDAAHAMVPHQGSGAGQAIEDGFILATVLTHPNVTSRNLPAALKVHDQLRRPFSQSVQDCSWETGALYHFRTPDLEDMSEAQCSAGGFSRERLHKLGDVLKGMMRWALEDSIMDQREEALALLAQL